MREIFLMAGQSNMSGRAPLPGPAYQHGERVFVHGNDGVWRNNATDPVDSAINEQTSVTIDTNAGVGPALSFADRMAALRPDVEIGISMTAKGGTNISAWRPDYRLSAYYGVLLWRAKNARKDGTLKGLVWYQGESDAVTSSLAEDYANRFTVMVNALRTDLNMPDLPVVFVQLGPLPAATYPYRSVLNQNMWLMRDESMAMVSASDLSTFDGIHLTTPSYQTIGIRMADAMMELI